jgi:hypothetical protein
MYDSLKKTITKNENIILNLDENNLVQFPVQRGYLKDITFNSQNLSKENLKIRDLDHSNSIYKNTFSKSENLSKISPIPKPDFSSITKFENSLSYKQKAFQNRNKLNIQNYLIKSPTKYTFNNQYKIKYCQERTIQKSACRKLNFFEGDESKYLLETENIEEIRYAEEKKDLSEENLNFSFNQSSTQNSKNSDCLMNNENNNLSLNLKNKIIFSPEFSKKERIKKNKCQSNLNLNFLKNNYYQNSNNSYQINEYKTLSADLSAYKMNIDFKLSMNNNNSPNNISNIESSPHECYYINESINNMNKIKRKRSSNENSSSREKKGSKFRFENVKNSEFLLEDEEIKNRNCDFSCSLKTKLILNEKSNSPPHFEKSYSINKIQKYLPIIENKKDMPNFLNDFYQDSSKKLSLRDFDNENEYIFQDNKNNKNKIIMNLFNEFDKYNNPKIKSDNVNEKNIEEREKIKREERYENLINQVNLFESFKEAKKSDKKKETFIMISNENEGSLDIKKRKEGKNFYKRINYILVVSRYDSEMKIIRHIKSGFFSSVYQCQSKIDNKIYAVKKSKNFSK